MKREINARVSIALTFTVLVLSVTSVDSSAEPIRLGTHQVWGIAFNPDGTILAAAHRMDPESDIYDTQAVIFWDLRTHQQVSTLEIANIRSLNFSPDGTLLALGGADNEIRLLNTVGQDQVGLIQSTTLYGVSSLAFSPDGKTLASSGSGSAAICLWDVQTQQQLGTLTGHTGNSVGPVVFSPDGRQLFSGGRRGDESIRVWDVQAQEQVSALTGHLDATYDLAFSPYGAILASAGGYKDKAVYLWDIQTQNRVGALGGHSAHVLSVAFSLNSKFLASTVNWDDAVYFWDIEMQEQMGILEGHDAMDSGIKSEVAFSPDGKWLACGSERGVELWELDQPEKVLTELMLFVMREFYLGNVEAELAWNSLIDVQAALAALENGSFDGAQVAMDDLKVLINQEESPRADKITSEAAAEIIERANEIIVIVAFRYPSDEK